MFNEEVYALGTQRSCIRELFAYGAMRKAQVGEENVYDFSLGNPSIPAPSEVNEILQELIACTDPVVLHGYTAAQGAYETRKAIADNLNERFSAGADAEDLFITCGAAPGLTAIFKALATPGAEIAAIAPYFPEYKVFVEQAGAVFREVPPDIPDFGINLAAVEETVNANTVALIVNSPNNPSGRVYDRQTLEALADLLRRKAEEVGHPIYIVADEPYRELAYEVEVPFLPGIYENTLVCYSYSKSLSLPGERIGYVYVPQQTQYGKELYAGIAGAARGNGHVCAPALLQKLIAKGAHLGPNLNAYDRNRTLLYEGLVEAGYTVAKPDGAFYLFVKAPGGDANAFSEKAKRRDVLAVPGDGFGCPGYFRLCYCVKEETILKALPIFAQLNSK